jgi:Chromo (CHRromatin Organisation MOdifier) domain
MTHSVLRMALDEFGVDASLLSPGDSDCPGAVMVDGQEEYEVDKIVDEGFSDRNDGRGKRVLHYRVRWKGWSPQSDTWLAAQDADGLEALDRWLGV